MTLKNMKQNERIKAEIESENKEEYKSTCAMYIIRENVKRDDVYISVVEFDDRHV